MVKKIDNKKIIFSYNFPVKLKKIDKIYTVTIGVGANITNCIKRFKILYNLLYKNSFFKLIQTSIIFKNPPFGYLEQDDFYNTIFIIKTNLPPKKILKKLQFLEKRFKRKRYIKDGPRTLDLDIIFIQRKDRTIYINEKDLIVPHPKWFERESVLVPLKFIKGVS